MKRDFFEPVLGIDFGTSNSAAALIDANGQLQVMPLDGLKAAMPTALFFSNETHGTFQAISRRYRAHPEPIIS